MVLAEMAGARASSSQGNGESWTGPVMADLPCVGRAAPHARDLSILCSFGLFRAMCAMESNDPATGSVPARSQQPPVAKHRYPRSTRDQPLLSHPIQTAVEAALEAVEQFVDLAFGDDQRRTEGDPVAQERTGDDAFFLREAEHGGGDEFRRVESGAALLVRHQLDAADEPHRSEERR